VTPASRRAYVDHIRITVHYTPPVTNYTLTYTAGDGGTISGDALQTVAYGEDGTPVTAVPNPGYSFSGWSDGVTTASRTDTNITANLSVTANFAPLTYTLTYTAGDGGTISGTSPQTVEHGSDGTEVIAVANPGYHFVGWSDFILTAARTDTNVTGDKTVEAIFALNTYTVIFEDWDGTVLDSQTVAHGSGATAPADPTRTGYTFTGWSADFSTITADLTVTAEYDINTYTLTYTAGDGGTISGTSPQTVEHGSDGTEVIAVANPGYHFVGWSDFILTAARTDTNVTGDKTVEAIFALNTYTVIFEDWDGTVLDSQTVAHGSGATAPADPTRTGYTFTGWSADFSTITADLTVTAEYDINTYTLTYTAGDGGTISGTSPQTVEHGSDGTEVTAVPNPGYSFVKWSDDRTDNPRTDTSVTSNITVEAIFAADTYTLTYTAGDGGTISGTSPQTVAYGGSGTTVTAVPDTGYTFVKWSDDVMTATRTDVNVTGDISVEAIFASEVRTLTYTAGDGGTISGTSPQTVAYGSVAARL
jgi:uncharacterized repeat protein (TIGR02543 family)